jgi:hypothetical protein
MVMITLCGSTRRHGRTGRRVEVLCLDEILTEAPAALCVVGEPPDRAGLEPA